MDLSCLTLSSSQEKLKCTSCQRYLSYFPIRVTSNNKNICGRCIAPDDEQIFRNVAFETLSQFLKFPCSYRESGCDVEITPPEVPNHEQLCKHRSISCLLNKQKDCKWQGSRFELLEHCQQKHKEEFLKNQFVMDVSSRDEHLNFIEHKGVLLLFVRKFDGARNVLTFEMYTNEFELDVKKFNCKLTAICGNKNLTTEFVTSSFDSMSSNELNLESVIVQSNDHKVNIHLTIITEVCDVFINLDMLAVLKCLVCSNYAVPPIYQCGASSSTLCADCKSDHQRTCTTCRINPPTRNINLDKMANILDYPCKYQTNGCKHIAKPEKIAHHQLSCGFGDFSCPLIEYPSCTWKGLYQDLENHILTHQELVTNSSQITKRMQAQQMRCDVVKFAGNLFRLVGVKTIDERYMWAVQVIGPYKEGFKYEIEILDPAQKGRRLLFRQPCGELLKKEQLFKTGNFGYFLKEQMKDFVADQFVTFKVNIFV